MRPVPGWSSRWRCALLRPTRTGGRRVGRRNVPTCPAAHTQRSVLPRTRRIFDRSAARRCHSSSRSRRGSRHAHRADPVLGRLKVLAHDAPVHSSYRDAQLRSRVQLRDELRVGHGHRVAARVAAARSTHDTLVQPAKSVRQAHGAEAHVRRTLWSWNRNVSGTVPPSMRWSGGWVLVDARREAPACAASSCF